METERELELGMEDTVESPEGADTLDGLINELESGLEEIAQGVEGVKARDKSPGRKPKAERSGGAGRSGSRPSSTGPAPVPELSVTDPKLRKMLRDSFNIFGNGLTAALGVSQLTAQELDTLTDGWAPIAAQYMGALGTWGPWIMAASATVTVAAPRVQEFQRNAAQSDSTGPELVEHPSPTF